MLDASTTDFLRRDRDGAVLCSCAPKELWLRLVFGPLRDQLYAQLWDLTPSFPDKLSWITDLLERDIFSFQETLGASSPFGLEMPAAQPIQLRQLWRGGPPSPSNSDVSTGSTTGTGASGCSHSSDSGGKRH